jgi:hypothetical protein
MSRNRARSAAKVATLTNSDAESGLLILCALLMFASLVSMWSHWDEIAESLGIYSAGFPLSAVTSAALLVAVWVNSGDE